MKVVIIVPTYNEKENIGRFIDALLDLFDKNPQYECHILIVDGNSPDGTAVVVRQKASQHPFVHLLMEKKKVGLGAAYIYGFKYAVKTFNPDVLVEMDADFQHNPSDVPRLLAEIGNGYDYVIGSRFINGGGIPQGWSFYRKFLSIGGNLFSKVILGITSVNDFTSGFKAARVRGFVDKIDLDSVLSGGFAYKIDLLYKMFKLGARIKEVPIKFGVRDRGDSKMEKSNFVDSLRVVLLLRLNENKSFFKFCIVGFVGLFVDAGLFNILRLTLMVSRLAALTSGFIAMLTTFVLNNYWSFGKRKIEGAVSKVIGFVMYIVLSAIPIVIRSKLVGIATHLLGDTFLVSNTAFFIGIVFGLVWNFTVYSKMIWRKK